MTTLAGRYVLERRLGGGGMAEVYLARTVGADGFSRPVAIKRVLSHHAADPAFAKMFVAEAQLCSRLQHPNIVSVLDFDRDADGRPFLVIELVDGPNLAELADTGMLPLPAAIHLGTELLRGLGYAHELPGTSSDGTRGVVHRDISPHNVLLSWEGAVKLSDFGIAKVRAASGVTASEMLKGKPAYMSPEQANGEALDGRSDLFAVGIVLWELVCGRPLFAGQTTQETLARVLFAPTASPRSVRPEVPVDLERVIMTLLARDPAERYADASAAIADLVACADHPRGGRELLVALLAERFADNAPQRARTVADVPTVRTPPEVAATRPSPRDAMRPGRLRSLWLALAGVAVGAGAVAAVLWTRGEPTVPRRVDERGAQEDPGEVVIPTARGDAVLSTATAMPDSPRDADLAPISTTVDAGAAARRHVPPPRTITLDEPTRVEPGAFFEIARREAERLVGTVAPAHVQWRGFAADGTVNTTKMAINLRFRARTRTAGICDVWFSAFAGVVTVQLIEMGEPECSTRPLTRAPACSAGTLWHRAVEAGAKPEGGLLAATYLGGTWRVTDPRGGNSVSIDDCH